MKTTLTWNNGMLFDGTVEAHKVSMDAKSPLGKDSAPTPKELVALGLGGCTAMDVIALLKKYKQLPERFTVDVEIEPSSGSQPVVFKSALVTFSVQGSIDANKLNEAVKLSQTKYCGVSAMLSQSFPIHYRVVLNGQEVGAGSADFQNNA